MSALPPAADPPGEASPADRSVAARARRFRRGPNGQRDRVVARLEARGSHARWVLWAGLAGMFANTFPFTILAVSLSSIAGELGVRETTMAWVITAPMLASAVALPILGKLGDLYGHRRVFLLGSALAMATALATSLAWSASSLIGLRTLSAVLGAATGPSSMALIFSAYEPRERTRAMGWWSMTGAGAPALGLIAGGPLVELLGWRVLFLLQGGFALLALAFAWVVLIETPRQRVRFDVLGAAVLALGVGALMYALGRARDLGLAPELLLAAGFGAACVAAFLVVERRAEEPLLPLEFFRRRNFTAPILSGALQNGAYMGAFVLAPFVLIEGFDLSISAAAGIMLMRTLTLSIASPLGGHLGARVGERPASVLGNAIIAGSMALLAAGADTRSLVLFGAGLVAQGLGQGLAGPSLSSAVAGSVPAVHLGIATASNRLLNQVGTAAGIALVTSLYGGAASGFRTGFTAGLVLAGLSVAAACFLRSHHRMEPPELSEPASQTP